MLEFHERDQEPSHYDQESNIANLGDAPDPLQYGLDLLFRQDKLFQNGRDLTSQGAPLDQLLLGIKHTKELVGNERWNYFERA